jgi:hypothetical protein
MAHEAHATDNLFRALFIGLRPDCTRHAQQGERGERLPNRGFHPFRGQTHHSPIHDIKKKRRRICSRRR